jgi:hypothetical protein
VDGLSPPGGLAAALLSRVICCQSVTHTHSREPEATHGAYAAHHAVIYAVQVAVVAADGGAFKRAHLLCGEGLAQHHVAVQLDHEVLQHVVVRDPVQHGAGQVVRRVPATLRVLVGREAVSEAVKADYPYAKSLRRSHQSPGWCWFIGG